jgi:hypothetical protein
VRSPQSAKPVESPRAARRASLSDRAPARGRRRASVGVFVPLCAALCALAGCSGQSTFLTRGPTVGQLKTSLSHLEYENEQLRKSTAKLERENRSMEDRLVQEQLENGDVTARLDNARNLLRERGIDDDVRLGSHRSGEALGASASERDGSGQSSFTDASRSKRRKTPFAQISGSADSVAPIEVGDPPAAKDSSERPRTKSRRSVRASDDDPDRQSYQRAPRSWLPVADSLDDSTIQIR